MQRFKLSHWSNTKLHNMQNDLATGHVFHSLVLNKFCIYQAGTCVVVLIFLAGHLKKVTRSPIIKHTTDTC
jgi:hypothetical protein